MHTLNFRSNNFNDLHQLISSGASHGLSNCMRCSNNFLIEAGSATKGLSNHSLLPLCQIPEYLVPIQFNILWILFVAFFQAFGVTIEIVWSSLAHALGEHGIQPEEIPGSKTSLF